MTGNPSSIVKILIISFSFPPNKDGVSEAAAAMAFGFANRGWHVHVLTETTSPARKSDVCHGVRIFEFSSTGGKRPGMRILGGETSYTDFLLCGGWDLIVIHAYELALRLAIPLLKRIPCKKILVSHGYAALAWVWYPKFPFGLVGWLRSVKDSLLMSVWLRHFDRTVYLSQQADLRGFYDHFLAKASGYQGRRVIPNGIDLEERGKDPGGFRLRHGIAGDAFVFLCVANYSRRKDQGYGARAFRKAGIPGGVLVFIGSEFNEHARRFQEEDARCFGPDSQGRIIWLEKQSRESTLDAFAACDAFLLSANHEAQPIAILEAMREGKPWIARKAGCIASMEGGLCVNSVSAMAAAMVRLVSDSTLQQRLSHDGLKAVAIRYDRKAYVNSYCGLVEELFPQARLLSGNPIP